MTVRLHGISISHPSHAARLMLEHKGIEFDSVDMLPGLHPVALRARGFRGGTVPALLLDDGTRVQHSIAIAKELDRRVPDPPLYPAEPHRRRAVEEAEAWGERELQPIPRRLFRYLVSRDRQAATWTAREVAHMPAPGLMGVMNLPVARLLAWQSGASTAGIRRTIARLPLALDEADRLIEAGTVGGPQRNAADFQIGTSMRAIAAFPDLREAFGDRPCMELGRTLIPDFPDLPVRVPPQLLAGLSTD